MLHSKKVDLVGGKGHAWDCLNDFCNYMNVFCGINNYIILAKGETIGGTASNIDVGTIIHKVYNFLRVCKSRTLIGMFGWILEIRICMGANLFSSYQHFHISTFPHLD